MNDDVLQGVGIITIPATGEVVGQYAYEAEFASGFELPSSLQVDVPVGVAVRCQSAGLSMEIEIEDGRRVVFVVTSVGPGGADVAVVATRGTSAP